MLPISPQNPNFISDKWDENQRSLWYKEMYYYLAYRPNTCLYIIANYQ